MCFKPCISLTSCSGFEFARRFCQYLLEKSISQQTGSISFETVLRNELLDRKEDSFGKKPIYFNSNFSSIHLPNGAAGARHIVSCSQHHKSCRIMIMSVNIYLDLTIFGLFWSTLMCICGKNVAIFYISALQKPSHSSWAETATAVSIVNVPLLFIYISCSRLSTILTKFSIYSE